MTDLKTKCLTKFTDADWRQLRREADARRAAQRQAKAARVQAAPTREAQQVQLVALLRRERLLQPEGAYQGVTWHPSAREGAGLEHIAAPTAARPHTLKDAARTLKHVKHLQAQQPAFFQEILASALALTIPPSRPELRDLQAALRPS